MRKEVIIAIAVGAVLGLVVTYGIYTANQAIVNKQAGNPQTTTIPTPTTAPEASVNLTLDGPEDGIVVSKAEITIQGTANPEAIVALISETDEMLFEADEDGFFAQDINLIKGANTIQVTASDGEQVSPPQTLRIVYSTAINQEEDEN